MNKGEKHKAQDSMTTKSLLELQDKQNLQVVKAKFTHGIFTPLKPLKLQEGEEVVILLIGQDQGQHASKMGTVTKKRDRKQKRVSKLAAIKRKMNARTGLNKAERRIAIKAGLIDKDQEWFWTPEWQKKEREGDEDLKKGRYQEFSSIDDLFNDLENSL